MIDPYRRSWSVCPRGSFDSLYYSSSMTYSFAWPEVAGVKLSEDLSFSKKWYTISSLLTSGTQSTRLYNYPLDTLKPKAKTTQSTAYTLRTIGNLKGDNIRRQSFACEFVRQKALPDTLHCCCLANHLHGAYPQFNWWTVSCLGIAKGEPFAAQNLPSFLAKPKV